MSVIEDETRRLGGRQAITMDGEVRMWIRDLHMIFALHGEDSAISFVRSRFGWGDAGDKAVELSKTHLPKELFK